ncbi:MAG: hypothetical protein V4528_15170 [Pseudomonadota bacterium]
MSSDTSTLQKLLNPTTQEKCIARICFINAQKRLEYETRNNCTFVGNCHPANGADIFRWAIGKKETGNLGYDAPDSNPCNKDNEYCAATTGNPASAGRKQFYSASYGPQQITLAKLFEWINPSGKTKFSPVPECLQKSFLDDKALIDAMKDANKRFLFGKGLVSGRKVPAVVVNADGSITYPPIPKAIRDQAEKLNIGKGTNAAEWLEMWQRMAAWERLRQIIEAKWKETGGDKKKAWGVYGKIGDNGLVNSSSDSEFVTLLKKLEMKKTGDNYIGIKPYVTGLHGTTPIWAEAANTFGNYALFAGAPPNLYTRLMAFFANKDCHIAAVKQLFQLPKHGYDGKHADPKDAETEKWVKKAAKAWNGSPGYADLVWPIYKSYYSKHYGKTEVCN